MAKRKTGLSQQLAAVGGTAVASAPTRRSSSTRSFGATGGQALPGTTLNQSASNPRYGQRFRNKTKTIGGVTHVVHAYGNGHTIDMGPLTKGRPTAGATLGEATATMQDALSTLAQKSEKKLVHALADHYANIGAQQAMTAGAAATDRHFSSDPGGGQNAAQYGWPDVAAKGKRMPSRKGGNFPKSSYDRYGGNGRGNLKNAGRRRQTVRI
jgi:hypothetical protein